MQDLTITSDPTKSGTTARSLTDLGPATAPMRPIIVVLGMHRSGTSLCANLLSALGVDMADDVGVNEGNTKGHWERWEFMQFHDNILGSFNRSYASVFHDLPLPGGWWAMPAVRAIRSQMEAFLRSRMHPQELFGFKDPRTVRLMPVWLQIFRNLSLAPKFVVCVRNPADVARSLLARDRLPIQTGEYRWLVHNTECFRQIASEHVVIDYDSWFDDRDETLERLGRFIRPYSALADRRSAIGIEDIIDADLRRSRSAGDPSPRRAVSYFYQLIRQPEPDTETRAKIGTFIEQFSTFQRLLPFGSLMDALSADLSARTTELAEARVALAASEARIQAHAEADASLRAAADASAQHAAHLAAEMDAARTREQQVAAESAARAEEITRLSTAHAVAEQVAIAEREARAAEAAAAAAREQQVGAEAAARAAEIARLDAARIAAEQATAAEHEAHAVEAAAAAAREQQIAAESAARAEEIAKLDAARIAAEQATAAEHEVHAVEAAAAAAREQQIAAESAARAEEIARLDAARLAAEQATAAEREVHAVEAAAAAAREQQIAAESAARAEEIARLAAALVTAEQATAAERDTRAAEAAAAARREADLVARPAAASARPALTGWLRRSRG